MNASNARRALREWMRWSFFRLSRDEVLVRVVDGRQHVLWPSGRWAPLRESFEDTLQRDPMTEAQAQAYADEQLGRRVDLRTPVLTDEEHAAEGARSRAGFVANDVAEWGERDMGAYQPGTKFIVNGKPFDPTAADASDPPDAGE